MKNFNEYLESIMEPEKRKRMEDIFHFIHEKFPHLQEEIKWNQPMFSDHGTFIIGFSISKNHIAVAPEEVVMKLFESKIKEAGYTYSKGLFRIKWTDSVNFDLLFETMAYNIADKKDMSNFWRK